MTEFSSQRGEGGREKKKLKRELGVRESEKCSLRTDYRKPFKLIRKYTFETLFPMLISKNVGFHLN